MFYLTYSKKVKSFLISKRRLETSQMFPFIKIYVLNSKNNFSFFTPFKNGKTAKNFHCLYVKDNDEDLDELDYEDFSAFTEQIETSTK